MIRLIARPGWGKTTFALQLAAEYGAFAIVDCSDARSSSDLDERLAAALAAGNAAIVVDNAERFAEVPDTVAALRRAIEEHGTRFIVASRLDLSVRAGRAIAPHEVLTLGADDLGFDPAEVREIFAGLDVPEDTLQRVIELVAGWAIGVFFFARLAREGRLDDALADLNHPSLDDLYAYAERETIAFWTPDERLGVAAAVAIPQATPREVEEAVGAGPRLALEGFAARAGPVQFVDERFVVPPLPEAAVKALLRPELSRAREAAINSATAAGAHLRAAQIRSAAGDFTGAVEEMEKIALFAPGAAPSPSYAAFAKTLPVEALMRSRNVLLAVLTNRETQANPQPLLTAVERFGRELQRDSDPETIATVRAARGALLRMVDRPREAQVVLEQALALRDPSPERTALMTANLAVIMAMSGNVNGAEALLVRAGVPVDGPTLFPVERFEVEIARNQLVGDARRSRAAFERNVAAARFSGPAAIAQALRFLAAGAWLVGDDAATSTALAESNQRADSTVPPERRRVRASRPHLDEPVARYDRWLCVWYMSAALLEDDPESARRFVQVALDGCAQLGVPYLDAISALIAASLPGDDIPALIARARADAATIGHPALVAAVEAIVAGRYADAGILLPVARRIERSRGLRASTLRVDVLAGRVLAANEPLPLRGRELELLVALALERRALTREALVSRLWPEIGADEANAALRTAIYRLRKQLRDPDAVVSTATGYRLAETIAVDLLEAEQFVAGARRFGTFTDRERARLTVLLETLAGGFPSVYARWEWFAPYEQRMHDLLHDIGIALAEDDLRRGDPAAAIERAETLLRADALDEPANEIAIRAHIAAGRKSEALRRYRRYRDALVREYGVSPGPELSSLLDG